MRRKTINFLDRFYFNDDEDSTRFSEGGFRCSLDHSINELLKFGFRSGCRIGVRMCSKRKRERMCRRFNSTLQSYFIIFRDSSEFSMELPKS